MNQLEEQLRRAGPAAGLLRDLLRQERSAAEGWEVLERVRRQLTREDINAHLRSRWPQPPLTTVIVAPSADGLDSNCIVRRYEEPEQCLVEQ